MTSTRHRRRHQAGFLLLDVLTGIVLGLAILVALTATIAQYRHGSRRLADERTAIHLAERVLTDLQSGQAPGVQEGDFTAKVVGMAGPGPTPHTRWVEVHVQGPATFSLVGLVPTRGLSAPADGSVPAPAANPGAAPEPKVEGQP